MDEHWNDMETLEEPLRRFLGTRCRDDTEIDDIIQETFLRCARFRSGLRKPENLRPWAFRIAANVLLDRVRRTARVEQRRDMDYPLGTLPAPESVACEARVMVEGESLPSDEAVDLLERALAQLSQSDAELVRGHYLEGAPRKRHSDAMLKVHLYRARQRLAAAMRTQLRRQRMRELEGFLVK